MKLKRIFAIVLVALLSLTLFAACGKKDPQTSSNDIGASIADIDFINENGEAAFRIVVPAYKSDDYETSVINIIKAVKTKNSITLKKVKDDAEKQDIGEILIGNTNREATKTARQILLSEASGRANEYIICSIGKDIVIYGETLAAIKEGVKYFNDTFVTGEVITGGIKYIHTVDASQFTDVSICGVTKLSTFKIVRPLFNHSYIVQLQIDALNEYLNEKTGYILDQVGDNRASTTGNASDGSGTLTKTEPYEYEIIIGNCNRDGVKTFSDAERNTYEIRIEDKRIYLGGGSPKAIAMAVSEFTKMIKSGQAITSKNSVTNGDYKSALESYDTDTYYTLAWGDDFDGTKIDTSKWEVQWDQVATYDLPADGRKIYRGSSKYKNNYVENGLLYLDGVRDETAYYGGLLRTYKKTYFKYGYLEISALHPKGMGFWNSLWVRSTPGQFPEHKDSYYWSEVDIDECYGPGTWVYGNTFAHPRSDIDVPKGTSVVHVNNRNYATNDRGFWMDFHTYGFEWLDNTHVRFTCDGEVYADQQLKSAAEQDAFTQPVFIMLSLACGTASHGEPTTDENEWENTNQYITDWVHLYQTKGQLLYKFNTTTNSAEIVLK